MAPRKQKTEEQEGQGQEQVQTPASVMAAAMNKKENRGLHLNYEDEVKYKVSTGSLLMDLATKKLGPSVVRLVGQNNEGKTPEALEILRNFLATLDNSYGLLVKAEGRLSEQNASRCGLKFVLKPEEWVPGTVLVLDTNIFEFIIDTFTSLILNNPSKAKYCFIIDSMDAVILKDDAEKSSGDSMKVAGPQVLTKKFFQKAGLTMRKYGHMLVLISQVTAQPKIDPYAKVIARSGSFSGGNAAEHWADFIIEYDKSYESDIILDNPNGKLNDGKTKQIGKLCKITIQKSIVEESKKVKLEIPIKFGRTPSGIWREYEVVDMLMTMGLATGAGAWITVSDELVKDLAANNLQIPEKINGQNKFRDLLEANPAITEYLYQKLSLLV